MPPVISEAPEASSPPSESHVDDSIPVVPLRHPIRKAAAILLLVLAGAAAWNVATNRRFGWDVVATYLLSPEILRGALLTVVLTVISMIAGIALGTVLAVMRISDNPIVSRISRGFIWFFRGTPLLVQLIFWYNIAALYPTVSIGIPFGGPDFVIGSANSLITPLAAALLGLSLNEAAYMAEIIRSGIGSVDTGQYDAAQALGMNNIQLMRRVVLPQAMRVVLPPTGNEVISMLKATTLVSVLAISDLLYSAQIIYSLNYRTIPLLIVASCWYLLMTSILSYFQKKLENHYGRGFAIPTTTKRRWLALGRHEMNALMVEARGVRKHFGSVTILKGVDLQVECGSVTCLIGPSGSGKTTFLRCINHLENVDSGRLYVDGELIGYEERNNRLYELKPRQIAQARLKTGMVFQRFNLFPHMTVLMFSSTVMCGKRLNRWNTIPVLRRPCAICRGFNSCSRLFRSS